MELSGNLYEMVVTLGDYEGRTFCGTHGDGVLTTHSIYPGNATNSDWPGMSANLGYGVSGSTGSGYRGSSFYGMTTAWLRTSNRRYASTSIASRNYRAGIRCARTETLETYQVQVRRPGTIENETSSGTVSWDDPDEAKDDDGTYAEADLVWKEKSYYLLATNFDFDIPSSATIVAIIAEAVKYIPIWSVDDESVVLYVDGSLKGSDNSCSDLSTGEAYPDSDLAFYYGGGYGNSPLWDCTSSLIVPEEINDNDNFGVAFQAYAAGINGGMASIDQIRIIVFYTE